MVRGDDKVISQLHPIIRHRLTWVYVLRLHSKWWAYAFHLPQGQTNSPHSKEVNATIINSNVIGCMFILILWSTYSNDLYWFSLALVILNMPCSHKKLSWLQLAIHMTSTWQFCSYLTPSNTQHRTLDTNEIHRRTHSRWHLVENLVPTNSSIPNDCYVKFYTLYT